MATYTWTGKDTPGPSATSLNTSQYDLTDPNNWVDQDGNTGVPGAGDTAIIDTAGLFTGVLNVASLDIGTTVAFIDDTITVGGNVQLIAGATLADLILDGSTLDLANGASVLGSGDLTLAGSAATLLINQPLSFTGELQLTNDQSAGYDFLIQTGTSNYLYGAPAMPGTPIYTTVGGLDTDTTPGVLLSAATLAVSGDLIIGDTTSAVSEVNYYTGPQSPALLTVDGNMDIGRQAGVTGGISVGVLGTLFDAQGSLIVGDAGHAIFFDFVQGDVVIGGGVTLGAQSTGSANLVIETSKFSGGAFVVGQRGTATVSLSVYGDPETPTDHTELDSSSADIGQFAGALGVVSVFGTGPVWNVTGNLLVGDGGIAELVLAAGGVVNSGTGEVGTGTANSATVLLDGAGSDWNIANSLTIGVQGGTGTTSVSIADGAAITTSTDAALYDYMPNGTLSLASGGTLSDTELDMHNAATLTLTSGATLRESGSSSADPLFAGGAHGLIGNGAITIDAATLASPNAYITVGESTGFGGAGRGTLSASDGAVVTTLFTGIGMYGGDTGTLTLSGAGTTWTNTGNSGAAIAASGLLVGFEGTGALSLSNGAVMSNQNGNIVVGYSGVGSTTVTGAGSKLITPNAMVVGLQGSGTLAVNQHGTLFASQIYLGSQAPFPTGISDTLAIASGGSIATTLLDIAAAAGTTGRVDVNAGTLSVGGGLTVGDGGAGSLGIEAGSTVSSLSGLVGTGTGNAGTVTLDGAGSAWTITNGLTIGVQGGTGTTSVSIAGGAGITTSTDAASFDSMFNGTLTLASGGTLNETALSMYSNTDTLLLSSGAKLNESGTTSNLYAPYLQGLGANGIIAIDGATIASPNAYISIGDYSPGSFHGTVSASDGATVTALLTILGVYAGDSGTLSLSGAGTTWTDLINAGNVVGLEVGNAGPGTLTIASGATLLNASDGIIIGVESSGPGTVSVTGPGSRLTISSLLVVGFGGAGSLSVAAGGQVQAAALSVGTGNGAGSVALGSGGDITAGSVEVGAKGDITLQGGVLDPPSAVAIDAGGRISGFGTIEGALTGPGSLTASGGALELSGAVAATVAVAYAGAGATLRLDDPSDFAAAINGFSAGDTLALGDGESFGAVTNDGTNSFITVGNNRIELAGFTSALVTTGGVISPACFLAGTRIATGQGEVPVEALCIGDRVLTIDGTLQPIRWIGHRGYSRTLSRRNPAIIPIRIAAGALASGIPRRDLFLSPRHALYLNGVLVPVQHLVNGATIHPSASIDPICYFHIELDRHGVIMAEGAAAETFVDCNSRAIFGNAADFPLLYPDGLSPGWEFCAELVEHGPILAALRAQIAARAAALGHTMPAEARIALAPGRVRGQFAPQVERLRLLSSAATRGADRRRLGALITALHVDGLAVDLTDPRLAGGFHEPECHDGRLVRWTNGDATIILGGDKQRRMTPWDIQVEIYRIGAEQSERRAA